MSRTILITVFLILLLLSCGEGYLTDCNECYSDNYNVVLYIRYRNPEAVPDNPIVTLYEGNVSDSLILEKYYITDPYSVTRFYAMLYKDYSATLEFTLDGEKYIVTGSACPKVRYDETTCEEPCWYVYDNVIDLRLRYQ
jgi:hypothetical protein